MNTPMDETGMTGLGARPGRLTSEFWLVIILGGLLLLNGSGLVTIASEDLRWYAGLIGVYAGGRSYVKRRPVNGPAGGGV